mgnify:CR=1 FL=1
MGFFKKIFKGIGKVFKKIGKAIKRAFKKVGKWFGKLGVFGQIALSFIPGLGPMLSGLFKGLGQGALRILHKGLTATGLGGKIVKGASWIVDTAREVVGGIQKGFKTVTSGATSFIKNSTKWLGSKIPGVNKLITNAPETFFGTGGDSVLGRVGKEVTNNFAEFKDAIGGMLKGPEGRAALIEKELAMTKVGGVRVSTSEEEAYRTPLKPELREVAAQDLVKNISEDIGQNLGANVKSNFEKLYQGQYKNAVDFLEVVKADPGFVNKFINQGADKVNQWFNFKNEGVPFEDPFPNMEFPDPAKIFTATEDKGFFRSLFPKKEGTSGGISSYIPTPQEFTKTSATSLLTTGLSNALQTTADYSIAPTRAIDTTSNQFIGAGRLGIGQDVTDYSSSFGGGVDPYAFTPDINSIAGGMFNDGDDNGMYGASWFPGVGFGPQQKPNPLTTFFPIQYPQQ